MKCSNMDTLLKAQNHQSLHSVYLSTPISSQTKWREFKQKLLEPGQPDGKHLMTFVEQRLTQFSLNSRYQAKDIVIDAFLRGDQKLIRGEIIEKPLVWLRLDCAKVINEIRQEQNSAAQYSPQ